MMSTNLWALCMLCHSTEFRVRGSRHTHSLPLGFTTRTKACIQSDASLISSFLMTFMDSILSNSSFNESLSASGTLPGEHTIGVAPGFTSKWTTAFLIVPTTSNKSEQQRTLPYYNWLLSEVTHFLNSEFI